MINSHKILKQMTTMTMSRLTPEELAVVQHQLGRLASIEDVIRISELDQHNTTQEILRVIKPHVKMCRNCMHHREDKMMYESVFCLHKQMHVNINDSCNCFSHEQD